MNLKKKPVAYYTIGEPITNEDGKSVSLAEYYMQVLQEIIEGKPHQEYTALLDSELISELWRLPKLPTVRKKAQGCELFFPAVTVNDYCMPVLAELLVTITIDKLGMGKDMRSLVEAIRLGNSWTAKEVTSRTYDKRSPQELEASYNALKEICNPTLKWFVKWLRSNGASVKLSVNRISERRRWRLIYCEWNRASKSDELVISINVLAKSCPNTVEALKSDEVMPFTLGRGQKQINCQGSIRDKLNASEVLPQLVAALSKNPKLYKTVTGQSVAKTAVQRSLQLAALRNDLINMWTFDYLDLKQMCVDDWYE